MTEIRLRKAVGVVATQQTFTPEANVQKAVSGVVVQRPFSPEINVQKAVSVVVVQPGATFPKANVQKASGVVVTQLDVSGDALQPDNAARPVYRTGAVPYVSFATPGSSLEIVAVFPGTYTLLALRPDGTIDESTVTLVAGENSLPTEDFNQLVILRGTPDWRLVRRIKLTLLGRAGL